MCVTVEYTVHLHKKVLYLTDRPFFECINKIKAEITYPSDQQLYIICMYVFQLVVPSAINAASHHSRSHCISTTTAAL